MVQQQIQRKAERPSEPIESVPTADQTALEKLKADTDSLLDEIDEILEENAEEFVKGYVQRGGE